jgi:pimeloyl-ACP methyl ester carboxylesterase
MTAGQPADDEMRREPLVIAEQGHFFTALTEVEHEFGTSVTGMHVQFQIPGDVRHDPLILVHGGGGQGLDMLATPDGREGWATLFLRRGFPVYVVDRPGMGRSPYHPAVHGGQGPPAVYDGLVAGFTGPAPAGLPEHTQWPGDGSRQDPALAQFLAGQESLPGNLVAAHEAMRDGAAALLDRTGPSVVLTHSMGGPFGWLAADARWEQVRAIVAVEPVGPPFVLLPGIGKIRYGLTAIPVSYGTDEVGGEAKLTLGDLPIAVVTAESSGHGAADRQTADYLRRCGARVTEMRLAELGIRGNGHAMMLERNNDEIVTAITNWISGTLGAGASAASVGILSNSLPVTKPLPHLHPEFFTE